MKEKINGIIASRLFCFWMLFTMQFTMYATFQPRDTLLINDNWNFRMDHNVKKGVSKLIQLPHTWNSGDATTGNKDYYRGSCTYTKEIFVPKEWSKKRIYIKFEGVNTVSNLFVNGKHVGDHRGGYTAFSFEISNYLNLGEENLLTVRVSNALQLDVMPLLGDFNFYGGIYRDVYLITAEKVSISLLDFASSGIYLKQNLINNDEARITANVVLDNGTEKNAIVETRVSILDGNRTIIKTNSVNRIDQGESKTIPLEFTISKPHLWNGMKDPFVYKVKVEIFKDSKLVDIVTQPLGLRYFYVDEDKGFFLNGQNIKLKGVARHQDYSEIGNALRQEHHDKDFDLIKRMGANSIRLSHYPHDPYFYELLDKNGFIAWSEIPFVGSGDYDLRGYVNQPSFHKNGIQQLKEMIYQNFNRPSIIFWGLFNELKVSGDDPYNYLKLLDSITKSIDNSRLTVSASNIDNRINSITDLIGWNKYYGWYGGEPNYLGKWADDKHLEKPSYKICVSEYGAGASPYHHQVELEKPQTGSYWHPEEWQSFYHEENWKAINERPFIWGSFIWNMFDFGAAHRTEGQKDGINDKGLVSFDRKVLKDSYYFYQANWNKEEPVLYITSRRFKYRKKNNTHIKVYTNLKKGELFINGQSCGELKTSTNGILLWKEIYLSKGNNSIVVRGKRNGEIIEDECYWVVQ